MKKERERQHLSPTEKDLIIINVFKGQITSDVSESLTKNCFCVVNIPANKTRFYQQFDVTVNGFCKKFLKKKFTNWYAGQQPKQLAKGIKLDETNVKLLLSTPKLLHAGWIVDFYMEMTTLNGMKIIEIGWKASGIQDTIKLGSKGLPPIDPFEDIDPLINENQAANEGNQLQAIYALIYEELSLGNSRHEEIENDVDESDWEWEHERGGFDAFEDFLNE